jgi:hypothetical protein
MDDYHTALVDAIKNHFGDSLNTVQAYFPIYQSEDLDKGLQIETPAVLVEIEQFYADADLDAGDGRDALILQVALHCVLGDQTPNLQQELRNFAAEMLRLLKNKRLTPCASSQIPQNMQAMPGRFAKGQGGYDSFVVVFEQTVYLGEAAWQPQAPPQTVWFGRAINEQNFTGYEQVFPRE